MVCSTRTTDTIARVGGDEFMVVLTNVKEPAAISRVATKMLNRIKEPYHYQENELFIGASIGIVLCPDQGQNSALLLHKADKAMYQVKNSGKNNFAYYQEESIDPEN
jgi:diguanylate cyclase (GGDEF)-like protein